MHATHDIRNRHFLSLGPILGSEYLFTAKEEKMKRSRMLIFFSFMVFALISCGQSKEDELPDVSFMNFSDTIEMQSKLLDIFPEGTSRDFVEKVLIDKVGAKYIGHIKEIYGYQDGNNFHQYQFKRIFPFSGLTNGSYLITILFDDEDKVRGTVKFLDTKRPAVSVSGPTGL